MRFGRQRLVRILLTAALLVPGIAAQAQNLPPLLVIDSPDGGQGLSVSIQILAIMTALTLLPAALMMMTSFARIIIVLAILRQALGMTTTPSNQILIGITLFLTLFIMAPVFDKINTDAVQPYMNEEIETKVALERASKPFREFMTNQTRDSDLSLFARLAGKEQGVVDPKTVSFSVLAPAFITSELKTAFQMGFLLFVPFLVIDLVVASVLMAMGMMMLSPMLISLPFKLMLFVVVDGWALVIGTLASSFYI